MKGSSADYADLRRFSEFEQVRLNDPQVHRIIRAGGTLQDVVVALANEKELLFQRLIELNLISPKKIISPTGTFIWHCPDDLIPATDVRAAWSQSA